MCVGAGVGRGRFQWHVVAVHGSGSRACGPPAATERVVGIDTRDFGSSGKVTSQRSATFCKDASATAMLRVTAATLYVTRYHIHLSTLKLQTGGTCPES